MIRRTFDSGRAATMLCAGLILTACGGGGGSGSSASPVSSSGDATTLKAGLYDADVKYTNGAPTQEPTAYFSMPAESKKGTFAIVFRGGAGLSFGALEFDSGSISGTSTDYRQLDAEPNPEGFLESKGSEVGTISGTINSQESATFSTANAEGEVNTQVTLDWIKQVSVLGVNLESAAGNYTTDDSKVTLTLGGDGSLYAEYYTPTTGCILGGPGTLSIPVASINVFNISYTMSNCTNESRNGEYSGVGFFVPPTTEQQMKLVFAAHNGKVAMQFEGAR